MEKDRTDEGQGLPAISRRRFLLGASALVGGSLLSACTPNPPQQSSPAQPSGPTSAPAAPAATSASQAASAPAPASTKPVVIAMPRDIGALDARRHRTVDEQNVFFQLYDSLLDLDTKLQLRPRLAESFEMVDPLTWRFKLRQGVKFTNGEDFTAENVKFTVEQFASLDPPYYYINLWGPGWPPSAVVESPTSVLIKTKQPIPILPRLMTRFGMLPIKAATDASYADNPITTGPYKLAQWQKGVQVILDANPNYWKGAPKIPRLIYKAIPDDSTRVTALEAGEVDVAWSIPADRAAKLAPAKLTTLESASVNLGQLIFNFRNPKSPIADVKVRKAMTMAIDGKGIIDAILMGKANPSKGPAPMAAAGAADVGGYPARDVAGAKKLLADAGYPSGVTVNMIADQGEFPKDVEIMEAVIGQLKEAGVTLNLEQMEAGQYSQRRATPNWDTAANGVGGWTGDAEFFFGIFTTASGYTSKVVDDLLAKGNAAGDANKRFDFLKQAQQAMWDDVPYLWSYELLWLHGISKRIQGAQLVPNGWLLLDAAQATD